MKGRGSTVSPPNSMKSPVRPTYRCDAYSKNTELAVVTSNNAITPRRSPVSRFRLPPGWGVEEVLRSNGYHIDKYYYEPGTGRKFRSTREVESYLNGEPYAPRSRKKLTLSNKHGCQRMIVSGGKMLKLRNKTDAYQLAVVGSRGAKASPCFKLPDGWIVEKIPRKLDSTVDKYYYEPGTGRKFRSLVSVERYLVALEQGDVPSPEAFAEIEETKCTSKVLQLENHKENPVPRIKNIYRENMPASSFISPPAKVNWVLSSPNGDAWNPVISDIPVPDSVKLQWTKRFMRLMSDGNLDVTNCHA